MTSPERIDREIEMIDTRIEHHRDILAKLRRMKRELVVERITAAKAEDVTPYTVSGPWTAEQYMLRHGVLYGSDDHWGECDKLIRVKMSGVGCGCGARWYCA